MPKATAFSNVPNAYDPMAFNSDAFNLITYSRPERENAILYFPERPESGQSTLEDLISQSKALPLYNLSTPEDLAIAASKAKVSNGSIEDERGTVVPFLEAVYPVATMFNTATGAWTSAQAISAMATVDLTNVFRALESIPGQQVAGVVVESPNSLIDAMNLVSTVSSSAILASSIAPTCMEMRLVDLDDSLARFSNPRFARRWRRPREAGVQPSPLEIYEAAVANSPDHRLILLPFVGLKAKQQEFCCDGIFVNGAIVFSAFSEKRRVDSFSPYRDRRITTSSCISENIRNEVTEVVVQVLDDLRVKQAVFHSEHCLTDQGLLLSDLMTRPGGGFIPDMIKAKFGVDLRAAHVYANFCMGDDLNRIAKEAIDTGEGAAIGSCYEERAGESPPSSISGLVDRLVNDKAVIAYNVVGEFSNSVVGLPDFRASLAVVGADDDTALNYLDEIAGAYGLD
ncbi:MAG: hypothetical protein F6J86_10580 [Symploca sp. SIO1B1]|nr:hypothetical protein [Symploca sp. SIO1B1]